MFTSASPSLFAGERCGSPVALHHNLARVFLRLSLLLQDPSTTLLHRSGPLRMRCPLKRVPPTRPSDVRHHSYSTKTSSISIDIPKHRRQSPPHCPHPSASLARPRTRRIGFVAAAGVGHLGPVGEHDLRPVRREDGGSPVALQLEEGAFWPQRFLGGISTRRRGRT